MIRIELNQIDVDYVDVLIDVLPGQKKMSGNTHEFKVEMKW